MLDTESRYGLTPQELECARLAGQRLANKEIAARLRISEGTVKNHLGHAAAKVGVSGRLALTQRLGLLVTVPDRHISTDGDSAVVGPATGEALPATETRSRSWFLPAPPRRRYRALVILGFLVAGAVIAMVAVATIWTTITAASQWSPPNAIRALD